MYIGIRVKYALFLSDFNEPWILLTDFEKSSSIYFMKIRPVESELFHAGGRADGWTDTTKLSRFSQFCERA
jgi:hypothetical protein